MKNGKIERYIQQKTEYVDILNYINYYKGKQKVLPILVSGPPGIGKSFMAQEVARELGCQFLDVNGHPGLTREDLEGVPEIRSGETSWRNGVIPEAIQMANKDGLSILIVNEFNVIRTNVHPSLNSIMDFQGKFCLTTNANLEFEVNEGCTLCIIATINEDIDGINPIQDSVKSRFIFKINLEYPRKSLETQVLNMKTGVSKKHGEIICGFARELRNAAIKEGSLQRAISTRELINFCRSMKVPGISKETAFEYSIINKLAEDKNEEVLIRDLMKGNDFMNQLNDLTYDDDETKKSEEKKNETKSEKTINAFLAKDGLTYTVEKIPGRIHYQGKEYQVIKKGRWCPENEWVAKILTNENLLVLYYKPTKGEKKQIITKVKFKIETQKSLF